MPGLSHRSWLSVHVFYDGDLDVVIEDLVGDIAARLAAEEAADGVFFIRYWEAGPHLRIRVRPAPSRADAARRIVTGATAAFLARRPAAAHTDQATYERYAPTLAEAERMAEYERHRRPNNSFAEIPYRPETHKYGTGPALHAVEDHFVRCSGVARELVTAGAPGGARSAAAFAMLALAWWTARAFGDAAPARDAIPAAASGPNDPLADRYRRQRDALRDVLDRTRALAAAAPTRPAGTLGAWAWSLAAAVEGLREPVSARQVIDHCAHLACNRLGLVVAQETTLRDLLRRALADHYRPGSTISG